MLDVDFLACQVQQQTSQIFQGMGVPLVEVIQMALDWSRQIWFSGLSLLVRTLRRLSHSFSKANLPPCFRIASFKSLAVKLKF